MTTATIVLGGTGYVAGELLRLLAQHPELEVTGVLSESRAGTRIRDVFPQLQNTLGNMAFQTRSGVLELLAGGPVALFSAAPHGVSAGLVAECLDKAATTGCPVTVVDVSADFRYSQGDAYQAVYGHPHGAPELLGQFVSAVPEHLPETDRQHIGHPGCFATALLLGIVPLVSLDLLRGDLYAAGITGSTGSGRSPMATTHHPERHSNLFAYKPLTHRHAPEVVNICAALTGVTPTLRFVPHSGPFARGIYITLQGQLKNHRTSDELRSELAAFYEHCEFVVIRDGTPRIKDVVGSNFCHLGVARDGESVAVFVAIDNLVKGAAGGAIQWMNRQLGLPEVCGLTAPALGWT